MGHAIELLEEMLMNSPTCSSYASVILPVRSINIDILSFLLPLWMHRSKRTSILSINTHRRAPSATVVAMVNDVPVHLRISTLTQLALPANHSALTVGTYPFP